MNPPPDDSNESGDYDSSYGEEEEEEEAEVRPTDDPIVEPSEGNASALRAAPKVKAKAKQRPRQPDRADPPQPAPRPEPKPKARQRRRGRDASEGSETSSAARTSEIREMLMTFRGSRSHYRDWKRIIEAQTNLYKLEDAELAMLIYLSCQGEPRQILNQLEVRQSHENSGGVFWREG